MIKAHLFANFMSYLLQSLIIFRIIVANEVFIMNQIITLENVSLQRKGQSILKDINWYINEGEHWAILGLNGSGKTSLLNIISGYQFPSSGSVSVLGNLFGKTNLPELRKRIGYVSSSLDRFSQIVNNETVERVVVSGRFASFGLYEQVEDIDWDNADALLTKLRLDDLKGKKYRLLSQGEQRRVLIARALMSNLEILILDEPCSGLDILSREEFVSLLHTISSTCHIIYVTHHIDELVKDITHVLLLEDGEIVAAGEKSEVLTDQLLSKTYSLPVKVKWADERPFLTTVTRN